MAETKQEWTPASKAITVVGAGNVGCALAKFWNLSDVVSTRKLLSNDSGALAQVEASDAIVFAGRAQDFPAVAALDAVKRAVSERNCAVISICAPQGFWGTCTANFPKNADYAGMARSPMIGRGDKTTWKTNTKLIGRYAASTDRADKIFKALFSGTPGKWARCPVGCEEHALEFTPTNPVVHPARLRSLHNSPAPEGASPPLFYGDWDDEASRMLLGAARELHAAGGGKAGIPEFCAYYDLPEDATPAQLTAKYRSIDQWNKIPADMCTRDPDEGVWKVDLRHRYVTEDCAFRLPILLKLLDKERAPHIFELGRFSSSLLGRDIVG